MSGDPVLMIASVPLPMMHENRAGSLRGVQAGQAFYTDPDNVAALVAAGEATVAGSRPVPRPRSVRGQAGFGAGAANSSP